MVETVEWTGGGVVMIDQRLLPRQQVFVTCRTYQEVAEAIKTMVIRGAPAIGVAAAMGVALGVQQGADFETVCSTLAATRPTAVNLFWAIDRMRRLRAGLEGQSSGNHRQPRRSRKRSRCARKTLLSAWRSGGMGRRWCRMAKLFSRIAMPGRWLRLGMALRWAWIRAAVEAGKQLQVFADETRPFLQGARLTA